MPISSFSEGLQRVISFLPGTYATSLFRNHATRGVFDAMLEDGIPKEVVDALKDLIDCNIYFFDSSVSQGAMYAVLCIAIAVFLVAYILMNKFIRGTK